MDKSIVKAKENELWRRYAEFLKIFDFRDEQEFLELLSLCEM